MLLISIDPGLRKTAVAVRDMKARKLLAAWLEKNPVKEARGPEAWSAMGQAVLASLLLRFPEASRDGTWALLLVETPIVHKQRRAEKEASANANELFQTSGSAGAVCMALHVVARQQEQALSDDWTNGVKKETRCLHYWGDPARRIQGTITPVDRAAVELLPAGGVSHDVLDSVMMGLWRERHWRMGKMMGGANTLPTGRKGVSSKKRPKGSVFQPAIRGLGSAVSGRLGPPPTPNLARRAAAKKGARRTASPAPKLDAEERLLLAETATLVLGSGDDSK